VEYVSCALPGHRSSYVQSTAIALSRFHTFGLEQNEYVKSVSRAAKFSGEGVLSWLRHVSELGDWGFVSIV
jgi:hypothetical protein